LEKPKKILRRKRRFGEAKENLEKRRRSVEAK
jgi:hypothetical protein